MNVLVTSASRKVGLVRAFGRAAAAVGGRVVAADVSPLAAALYEADVARLVPRSDDPTFLDAILDVCRGEGIGLLVPTRDEELPVFADARDRFADEGVLVLVSALEVVDTCQDKRRFIAACAAAGLATPHVVTSPTAADLPLFVRPVTGKGGKGARPVRTPVELAMAVEELGDRALWQESVEAPEFTLDVFIAPDGTPITCVPRERLLVLAGESYVGRTVRDEDLRDATLRLCAALHLTGPVTVQAFRRGDEVLFIEVNPRYGGGAALGFAAGAFTPALAVRLALGEALSPALDDYRVGLIMLRHAADIFLPEDELLPIPALSRVADVTEGMA